MKRLAAIQAFLETNAHPDLASRWHKDLETQVQTDASGGVPFTGEYKGVRYRAYHATGQDCTPEPGGTHERKPGCKMWKNFRIPWNADSEPEYRDSAMSFSLDEVALGIGSTGWNWKKQQSEWFGFDFDSVSGHVGGNALTDIELNRVLMAVQGIPWVEVRRSKSGKGFHLYVFLDEPIKTENHTEHAAVARAILDVMSALSGEPLGQSVDCYGKVVWLWHREAQPHGWEQVKRASHPMPSEKVPQDWHRHVAVTGKKRSRVSLPETTGSADEMEDLIRRRRRIALDDDHKALLAYLYQRGDVDADWSQDHWMLRTHTRALQDAHAALKMRGLFYTTSQGHDLMTGNCFAFPEPNGAWEIRRFGTAVEHPAWIKDNTGWVRCTLNVPPSLDDACRAHGGRLNSEGKYQFDTLKEAVGALRELSFDVMGVENFSNRKALVFLNKGEILVCRFARSGDESMPNGWNEVTSKGKWWEKTFRYKEVTREQETPDEIIRAVVQDGKHSGFWIYSRGEWVEHKDSTAQNVLMATHGVGSGEARTLMGLASQNYWREVNEPFGEEYPGDRTWNRRGAQLAIEAEQGEHPTWDLVLAHVGRGLDDALGNNEWCAKHGLALGEDYLRSWIAALFQSPKERLPYLFLFGPQGSGKSLFHEALKVFFAAERGYMHADHCLTNRSGFNGELASAVLCVVEETNITTNDEAYNRIKNWTTGETLSIRAMYSQPIVMPNYTHWVQCANSADYCPINVGDTRVVAIRVPKFEGDEIPKHIMLEKLRAEAPAFLHTVMHLEIPPTEGRLRIPVVTTMEKEDMERAAMTPLERFVEDECEQADGHVIRFSDFFEKFKDWLQPTERPLYSASKVGRDWVWPDYPKGIWGGSGQVHIGNIRFKDGTPVTEVVEGSIRRDGKRLYAFNT